jgi:predicted aspartyl protease/tetratricopeptide (TPR) repeat protein
MCRSRALTLLILALCAPALAQEPKCQLVKIAEWEVGLQRGLPIVEGAINGKKIGVLLDTGAYASLITKDAASRLGLPLRGTRAESIIGFGGESDVHVALVDELHIAGASRNNLRVRVSGERPIRGVDFILGDDFFRNLDMEFDYSKNMVRLFTARNCRNAPLAYWDRNAIAVEMEDDNKIVIPVKINGRDARALLDSGASWSMISLPFAARVGVTPDTPGAAPSGCSTGIGAGTVESWVAPFSSVAIGAEAIQTPKLQIGDFMPELARSNPEMILGTDFLRTHRVLVARSQRKVYFTYAGGQVFPATPALGCDERMRGKNAKEAIAAHDEAIKANPKDVAALVSRAVLRLRANDAKGALSDLDAALEIQPTNAVALSTRMDVRARRQDWGGALADSDAAIANGMRTSDMFVRRAALRVAQKDEPGALKEFEDALRLDPRNEMGLRGRAFTLVSLGRYEDAERDFGALSWEYGPLWASQMRSRRGADPRAPLEEGLKRLKADQWPAPVMHYMLGRIDSDALMAAAAAGAKNRKGYECEANYFVGARLGADGRKVEARALLEKARDECPRDFIEYGAALDELAKLGR